MNKHVKTYAINTFGCQMNAHDSEKLAGILENMGYLRAAEEADAGLVIYNTCCIRENAENKVIGNLGFLKHQKEKNPGLLVAVGGCMPQQEAAAKKIKKAGVADIIFGTHNLHMFGELLQEALDTGGKVVSIWSSSDGSDDITATSVREFPWRSGVNIMYGCDNYCSYCVVPFVRGRERSRDAGVILKEIELLLADGVKEIMLLGQNVNSYGQPGGVAFPDLLRRIAALSVPRIRFMTSHPKDFSKELIHTIKDCENICRHIHLPVQSGSDAVLTAMNRKYTRVAYLKLLDDIRTALPGIAVTTDIIVGFPGESEQDFEDTLSLVKEARFSGAFTFLYSKRDGTKAADMADVVPAHVAKERFQRLLDTINPIAMDLSREWEGKATHVLVEKLENNMYSGRGNNNTPVHFPKISEGLVGQIVPVKINEGKTFYMLGEQL